MYVLYLWLSVDMNLCANNPCQNGGTCTLIEGSGSKAGTFSYDCECPLGFKGTNCSSEYTFFHLTFMINRDLSNQIKCSTHKKLEHLCRHVASVLPPV